MQLTVQLQPQVMVEYDGDVRWREVSPLHTLNVLSRHPIYFRVAISDAMPPAAAHVAIEHEAKYLAMDLAQYIKGEEFVGFLTDQLKALYGRKEMVHPAS